MSESLAETKVGDIVVRKRKARTVLTGQEVAYGPLTLTPVENGILPSDFDGRVYETITTDKFDDHDRTINHIVTEADNRLEQLFDEL
jgi:hypothetical protein